MINKYSATRRVSLMGRTETTEQIEARRKHHAVLDAVKAEVQARFPVITLDNAREAIAFQQERLEYHTRP